MNNNHVEDSLLGDNLLGDSETLTLSEVCENCGLGQKVVMTYIEEGLIEVYGDNAAGWRFSRTHVIRIQKAARLERDLRLNPAGSVLVLELMAKIDILNKQIKNQEPQDDQIKD